MRLNIKSKIIAVILISIVIICGFFYFLKKNSSTTFGNNAPQKNEETKNDTPTSILFSSDKYNFTFTYQSEYKLTELDEKASGGETILVEGKGEKNSFQIYIAPFDESGHITPERIKKDLPKATVDNPQNALIANKTIPALIFFGKNESGERTREIWFVKNNNLYQVTAYDNMDGVIGPILESLKFEE